MRDVSNTASGLSIDQWALLWRLNPRSFDVFADMMSDINALMEEDRPNRLFFPGYTPSGQTLTLSLHLAMCG